MTAKHTPGPWYALRGQRNISIRHKTGDKLLPMVNVASVRGYFPTDCPYGSSEANARLIAAAPELLEAAKLVLEWYEAEDNHSGTDFYQRMQMCRDSEDAIRAAIAKATGEQT